MEPGSCSGRTDSVRRKTGVRAIKKKSVKGREQRRSRMGWRQHTISCGENSEGQDPRSASGVEQTRESLRTSLLPRGCENLGAMSDTGGTVFVTSGDRGAERKQTWGGSGNVNRCRSSVKNLEVGQSLKEDGRCQESSRYLVVV